MESPNDYIQWLVLPPFKTEQRHTKKNLYRKNYNEKKGTTKNNEKHD